MKKIIIIILCIVVLFTVNVYGANYFEPYAYPVSKPYVVQLPVSQYGLVSSPVTLSVPEGFLARAEISSYDNVFQGKYYSVIKHPDYDLSPVYIGKYVYEDYGEIWVCEVLVSKTPFVRSEVYKNADGDLLIGPDGRFGEGVNWSGYYNSEYEYYMLSISEFKRSHSESRIVEDGYSEVGYYNFMLSSSKYDKQYLNYLSVSDSLDDLVNKINNYVPPSDSEVSFGQVNFMIPRGNVAYIKLNGDYEIDLKCIMNEKCNFKGDWPDSNQYFRFMSSLPDSSTVLSQGDYSMGWERDGFGFFGKTYNAKRHISGTSTEYLMIVNPSYIYGLFGAGSNFVNGSINVSVSGASDIKMYPLSPMVNYDNGEYIVKFPVKNEGESLDYFDYVEGETPEDYTGFVDNAGDPVVQIPGIGNVVDDVSNSNVIASIREFLEGLVADITSLFTRGYSAVTSLVSSGSGFMQALRSIYSWLPSDVVSVVVSTLTLVLIIGVIKVFL